MMHVHQATKSVLPPQATWDSIEGLLYIFRANNLLPADHFRAIDGSDKTFALAT